MTSRRTPQQLREDAIAIWHAAGASADSQLARAARQHNLDTDDYLLRNDAYHFFDRLDGLIKTGPTHTNVCDVRGVVVDRMEGRN